jgi:hypothetical protein
MRMTRRFSGAGPGSTHARRWGGRWAATARCSPPNAIRSASGGVAVSSAAIWTTHAEQQSAVPDAFDGAADFGRNEVFAGAVRLAGTSVSISCGTSDPFIENDRAFAARLPHRPAGGFTLGCHDEDFWRRMLPAQVRFLGRAL